MLTCEPQSLVNWNFKVRRDGATVGAVRFEWLTEEGAVEFDGVIYDVRKHGPMSGHWTLERSGAIVADATKPSAFGRRFVVEAGGQILIVARRGIFGRTFDLHRDNETVGVVQPVGIFSRSATIDCEPDVSEPIQLFAFWLAALLWRRDRRRN